MKCKLNNDNWDDAGVIYIVHAYNNRAGSSGVSLELETPNGYHITRVVANHQIEWIEDED